MPTLAQEVVLLEHVVANLERKLAGAREALQAIVTFSIMAGETERDERFLKQINATAGDALKALTEAGEGENKE